MIDRDFDAMMTFDPKDNFKMDMESSNSPRSKLMAHNTKTKLDDILSLISSVNKCE